MNEIIFGLTYGFYFLRMIGQGIVFSLNRLKLQVFFMFAYL